MSTESRNTGQFERDVDYLIGSLTHATRMAAETDQQAAERDPRKAVLDGVKRTFRRLGQDPAVHAEHELEGLRARLTALHRGLEGAARAQLGRDVSRAARSVNGLLLAHENEVQAQPVHRRHAKWLNTDDLRAQVGRVIETIIPNAAASTTDVPRPPGSVLPPAARAFARGEARAEPIARQADERANAWWNGKIERDGFAATLPGIKNDLGGDPIETTRFVSKVLGGVPIGTTLHTKSREPKGPAVVDPNHTVLALGASGVGKTTGVVAPYAAMRAARGDNVVVVSPQPDTISLVLPTGKALSGQEHVPVVDFGGQIVSPGSPEFVSWDVTRDCLTPEGARQFARAFAGEHLPARQELTSSAWFGGLIEDMYAAAAHIGAGMRELHGLDPYLNGMARVYNLMKSPEAGALPNELPEPVQRALANSPQRLKTAEAMFREAREHAEQFNPWLQRIAFQERILARSGIPLSNEVVGEKLRSISGRMNYNAGGKQGDPTESLLESFKAAIPSHEVRVMSPRPGTTEIDPTDLVRPQAGLSIVTYSQTGSAGLAAGAFTSRLLDAAIDQNKEAAMLRTMGSTDSPTQLSLVVDEGSAGRHIPRLPEVVTDTRQLGINALLSMTSKEHLRDVFGDQAGKFLLAPCVVDLTPDPANAATLAKGFGEEVVRRRTSSVKDGEFGTTVSHAEHLEDVLHPHDVVNLPRGEAVMIYPSAPAGERSRIVELPQFADPSTVVGTAAAHVADHPEEFEPIAEVWGRLRPDLQEVIELQRDPSAALGKGTAEALEAALAKPENDPAAVARALKEPTGAPSSQPVERDRALETILKAASKPIEEEPGSKTKAEPGSEPAATAKESAAKEPAPERVDKEPAAEPVQEEPVDDEPAAERPAEQAEAQAPEPVDERVEEPAAEGVEEPPSEPTVEAPATPEPPEDDQAPGRM